MIIAATGHRPDKLGGYSEAVFQKCVFTAKTYLQVVLPKGAIVGMALGWDQAVAQACIDLGIPFTAAIPFEGQHDLWPVESQRRYLRLLACAEHVEIVTKRYAMPVPKAMQKRNEWMVDRCQSVLALWDGSFGGTHNCIRYAEKRKKPVVNSWEVFNVI